LVEALNLIATTHQCTLTEYFEERDRMGIQIRHLLRSRVSSALKSTRQEYLRDALRRPVLFVLAALLSFAPQAAHADLSVENELRIKAASSPFLAYERTVQQSFHSRGLSSYGSLSGNVLSLLQYIRLRIDTEPRGSLIARIPRYNRLALFGGWINDDPASSCYDTRAKALLRDMTSDAQPTVIQGTCTIATAHWLDPYTGADFRQARSVQIDHVVPLKNAYLSGAYAWQNSRRCHYANYLKNNYHLLTVSGHENMAKGDSGPENYMPPNEAFSCAYLNIWMKIKLIWDLKVTPDEEATIERLLVAKNCTINHIQMDQDEFIAQNDAAARPPQRCLMTDAPLAPTAPIGAY
jgi:hypothetical protein